MTNPKVGEVMIWRPENQRILDEWKRRYGRTEVKGVCLEPFGEGLVYFCYSDPVTHPVDPKELHSVDDVDDAVMAKH